MKKISINILLLFALLFALIFTMGCTDNNHNRNVACDGECGGENHATHNHAEHNYMPYENLSDDEIYALNITLNDEYRAEAIYQKVLDKFGDVRPFSNIINAEKRHSNDLIDLYEKYGLSVPDNDWYDKVPEFESVEDACKAGVQAEIDNAALYDSLFSKIDNQDIKAVFTSLRDASEYKHLPAFERCAGN